MAYDWRNGKHWWCARHHDVVIGTLRAELGRSDRDWPVPAHILVNNGYATLDELAQASDVELLACHGIGQTHVRKIRRALAQLNPNGQLEKPPTPPTVERSLADIAWSLKQLAAVTQAQNALLRLLLDRE